MVKGSPDGFVVTGTTSAGQIVAYTSTGTGGTWQPTGSLGDAAAKSVPSATVGAGGAVIAVGSMSGGTIGKQPVFVTAGRTGAVRPVSLTTIAGGVVPELAVNGLAAAGGEQIAVGSADGYPAVWRQAPGGSSWTLVSSLPVVSAYPGLSALTSVTHGPAGWLAVGEPGPIVLASADGTTWQREGQVTSDLAAASAVMTAFNDLRARHELPASKLFGEARGLFQQGRRDDGHARLKELVDKYYASSHYRLAMKWLAEWN